MAGAAAVLADVPLEGMDGDAAANAKEGCNKLANQTAIATNKTATGINLLLDINSAANVRFQGMAGQKNNDVSCEKTKKPRWSYFH